MELRHPILTLLVALALGAAYFVFHAPIAGPPCCYPGLESVSRAEIERADAHLPVKPEIFAGREPDPALTRALDGCPPRAVVAALYQRSGKPTGCIWIGPCFDDERRVPVGIWLAKRRDASLDEVLARIAADEEIAFDLRDTAVVALCRPGNDGALPALVRLATDMDADDTVRTRVLSRLDRIGVPPGGDFETLLYLPFRGHDVLAAAVLALTGRPVAPSLVLQGLAEFPGDADDREHLLVRAAAAIAEGDREVAARAQVALQAVEATWGLGNPPLQAEKQAIGDLAAALRRWLDQHPEARESRFERERRQYRESPQYARERRVLEASAAAALPETEIDFAAAAVRILKLRGKLAERLLDELDRLAVLFRRDLEGVTDPRERLAVLHRRLMPRRRRMGWTVEEGPSSFIWTVLRDRTGDCVGLTSLYVALGERLGLPLVAVALPDHVFLRWEAGEDSFDVELTDRGRIRTPSDLHGAVPRVLTKKGLVSVTLSNRSSVWLDNPNIRKEGRVERSLRYAEAALEWDPQNEDAHLARARCLARLGRPEDALASAQRAESLSPGEAAPHLIAGESLLLAGRPEEALPWFDRARQIDPGCVDAVHGRLDCLYRLGGDEEVLREAAAALDIREHAGIRGIRLRAMARLGREGWHAELLRMPRLPPFIWELRLGLAEIFLERSAAEVALKALGPSWPSRLTGASAST